MELMEEGHTVLKNKKLVLSSIAIIFTLVVCSIFVNFTMANSGNSSSAGNAELADSTTSTLTGYSNIDRAIMNSNSESKQNTGEDKFRIVQIVPDNDSSIVDAETALNEEISKSENGLTPAEIQANSNYSNTSYLWRYVYDGEYFRTAVFDQFKTISQNMAEGAVTLQTCTVSTLNKMSDSSDTTAQAILDQADFIYIWTDDVTDFNKSDLNQELYYWLDSYATADSHPIAICWKALGTETPDKISGNNDEYNITALAYKLMTKAKVARYDNVLVTDEDFFLKLYKKGGGKGSTDLDSGYTLYKFISEAGKRQTEGGYYSGNGTYFKWYRSYSQSFDEFINRGVVADGVYSIYQKVGGIHIGSTYNRYNSTRKWDFDNAKILVITESDTQTDMVKTLTDIGGSALPDKDAYKFNETTGKWASEANAENGALTSALYESGSNHAPSGADIYYISSSKLSAAYDSGDDSGKYKLTVVESSTYYKDVQTKSVSGVVDITDDAYDAIVGDADDLTKGQITARLVAYNNGTWYLTDQSCNVALNGDDEYAYEFKYLNPDYEYAVILDGTAITSEQASGTTTATVNSEDYQVGVATGFGSGVTEGDANKYVYNFSIKSKDETNVDGYTYRDIEDSDDSAATGTTDDSSYDTVNTYADLLSNVERQEQATSTPQPSFTCSTDNSSLSYLVLAEKNSEGEYSAAEVMGYVKAKHTEYMNAQTAEQEIKNINLQDYDFIFIDDGDYLETVDGKTKNAKINSTMYSDLMSAIKNGVYFIVSDKACQNPASDDGGDGDGGDDDTKNVGARQVADVINAGVYRDGSDNKYKVLEIQPDYPIDTELAESRSDKGTNYTKHIDDTEIKGNYYTTPGDMVEGKAKEEIDDDIEYYAFDLSKAKIAYALKSQGVRYSDVELTQVSTEALIGMKENIATTYDLVYVGGDISALDISPSEIYKSAEPVLNGSGVVAAGLGLPTFLMYTHTGILEYMSSGMSYMPTELTNGTVYMPENGNDLTKTKLNELEAYIDSGKPIIFSDELTAVYDKMNDTSSSGNALSEVEKLQGYWVNNGSVERKNYYLDPTSRMYELLEYTDSKTSKTNIIWGLDPDDTQAIDNSEGTYGNTLYSWVHVGTGTTYFGCLTTKLTNWDNKQGSSAVAPYNGATTWVTVDYVTYATVFSDDSSSQINTCVKDSAGRTRIIMTEQPSTYKQGITSTYVQSTNLEYAFEIRTKTKDDYSFSMYVDKNRDTVYDSNDYCESGSFTLSEEDSGSNYYTYKATVTVPLDADFAGSASWYLKVTSGKVTVAEETGLCKVVNDTVTPGDVNVLQIQTMNEGQSDDFLNMSDTLYFDIESQWAHKIMYYNGYLTQNNNLSQDTQTLKQNSVLGRHENRFGIVEYDTSSGDDDWLSNLADALDGDYNVNLDLAVISESKASFTTDDGVSGTYESIEKWVSEAEQLKDGGTLDGKTTADYAGEVDSYLSDYDEAKTIAAAAKSDIDEYLEGAITYLKKLAAVDDIEEPTKPNAPSVSIAATSYKSQTNYNLTSQWISAAYTWYCEHCNDANIDSEIESYISSGYNTNYWYNPWDNAFGYIYAETSGGWVLQQKSNYSDYEYAVTKLREAFAAMKKDSSFSEYAKAKAEYDAAAADVDVSADQTKYGKFKIGDQGGAYGYLVSMANNSRTASEMVELYEHCMDTGDYYLIFQSYYSMKKPNSDNDLRNYFGEFGKLFIAYRDAKNTELDAKDEYNTCLRRSYGTEFLKKMYSIIVLGPSSAFSPYGGGTAADLSTTAAEYIKEYVSAGGDLFFFHDTMTANSKSKGGSYNLTTTLIDVVGMNRYHVDLTNQASSYTNVGTATNPSYEYNSSDLSLYYLTPYGYNVTTKSGKYSQTSNVYSSLTTTLKKIKNNSSASNLSGLQVSALSMSYLYYADDKSLHGENSTKYIYASMDVNGALRKTTNAGDKDPSSFSQTAKASQLNEGLVTLYPFNIGASLNVTGTHQQAYSLDLETTNTTVWYTLAGTNNSKTSSSMYAASPYDAMESYFIYTSAYKEGAITYCGAGHTSVTGSKTKNNDERKMFINVIINSSIAAQEAPVVTLYEPNTDYKTELKKNKPSKTDTGVKIYTTSVESKSDSPDFDMKVKIPTNTTINSVKVYYDLDYVDSNGKVDYSKTPFYTKDTDVLVESYNSNKAMVVDDDGKPVKGDDGKIKIAETLLNTVVSEYKEEVRSATEKVTDDGQTYGRTVNLDLQDSYFAPYGGSYTFLVVEVSYGDTNDKVYAIIRINASDPLFDLTENTIDTIDVSIDTDYLTESKYRVG